MPEATSFHGFIIWAAMWGCGFWLVFVGIPLALQ